MDADGRDSPFSPLFLSGVKTVRNLRKRILGLSTSKKRGEVGLLERCVRGENGE